MESNALIVWDSAGLANALYLRQRTGRPVYTCWPLNNQLRTPVSELCTDPIPLVSERLGLQRTPMQKRRVVRTIRGVILVCMDESRLLRSKPIRVIIPRRPDRLTQNGVRGTIVDLLFLDRSSVI